MLGYLESVENKVLVARLIENFNVNFMELLNEDTQEISVNIELLDPRCLTSDQRKFGYAVMREVAFWSGYTPLETKDVLKFEYEARTGKTFSFAKSSKSEAVEFLNFLVNFCFENSIRINQRSVLPEQENQYLFNCIKHRICAVCGSKGADRHHATNLVGMGRNRNTHDHEKSEFIALCREHHTEAHNTGLRRFEEKYKIKPIPLNQDTVRRLKI